MSVLDIVFLLYFFLYLWCCLFTVCSVFLHFLFFFFFKQKTAYELRISDWSSDVCSSDLVHVLRAGRPRCKPRVLRRHLETTDRRAVSGRGSQCRGDRFTRQLGRTHLVGRQFCQDCLLCARRGRIDTCVRRAPELLGQRGVVR